MIRRHPHVIQRPHVSGPSIEHRCGLQPPELHPLLQVLCTVDPEAQEVLHVRLILDELRYAVASQIKLLIAPVAQGGPSIPCCPVSLQKVGNRSPHEVSSPPDGQLNALIPSVDTVTVIFISPVEPEGESAEGGRERVREGEEGEKEQEEKGLGREGRREGRSRRRKG